MFSNRSLRNLPVTAAGAYSWSDGRPLLYGVWAAGQPDALAANTTCGSFALSCTNSSGVWMNCATPQLRDVACGTLAPYVCSYGA